MRTVAATGKMWAKDGKQYQEVTRYEDGKISGGRYGWTLKDLKTRAELAPKPIAF